MLIEKLKTIKVSLLTVVVIIFGAAIAMELYLWQVDQAQNGILSVEGFVAYHKNVERFFEVGSLVKNNSGLEKGVWYLSYEKPGAPAKTIKLYFNANSNCRLSSVQKKCQEANLWAGLHVSVVGIFEGNQVVAQEVLSI